MNTENFFGGESKNLDKLIQSWTPGQPTKNWDCSGKTGQLEFLPDVLFYGWSLLKAVNVLRSYIKLCYIYVHFKQANQTCSPSKNSQSISVEWRTSDRNDKQFL